MPKVTIKFNNKTEQVGKGIAEFIDIATQRSSKVMERDVKLVTPVKEGTLRRSITSEKTGFAQARVFTNPTGKPVNYAVYLEYGTKYMAPRAMFRRGVNNSQSRIQNIFREEGKKSITKTKGID